MRRIVVSAVCAALVVLGALCASASARSTRAPADFEQRVPVAVTGATATAGAGAGAAGAGAARVTPVLRAPRPFDLLGLRWRGHAATAHVAVRVQRASGRWSRWGEIPPAEDAAADGGSHANVSGPLWTGRAVRYQLRARSLPPELRLHFVAVPRPRAIAAAAATGAPTASVPAGAPARSAQAAPGERPQIVPRSAWDPTNACPPRAAPRYGRVDFSVVHHTESLTSYSRAGAAAMVLAICRFHRNGNGWLDIGYNLLVDRFGTVYEGRAGGVEQPVIGAQSGGWNSVSSGVAVIGSFSSRPPPAAAQEALTRVLAWKLSLAGVPATGTIARVSSGGDENRWPSGATVRFARVSGHRDADSTDCPGGALYALLPRLRAQVAAQRPAPADLLTNSPFGGPLPQGGPAYLTGRLARADGRRPGGVRLSLQRREDENADWIEIGTVTTGSDGIWSTTVPVSVDGSFHVLDEQLGLASPAVTVHVAAGVGLRVSPQLLRPGGSVTLSGATTPAKGSVTVVVERQPPGSGRWTRVRRLTLDTVDGRYATQLALSHAGLHRFLVTTAADDVNAAGTSPLRTAQVRAPAARRRR